MSIDQWVGLAVPATLFVLEVVIPFQATAWPGSASVSADSRVRRVALLCLR